MVDPTQRHNRWLGFIGAMLVACIVLQFGALQSVHVAMHTIVLGDRDINGDQTGCTAGPMKGWRVYADFEPENPSITFAKTFKDWKDVVRAILGYAMIYFPVLLALYTISSTPYANLQLDAIVGKTFVAETILKTLKYECEHDDFFARIAEFLKNYPKPDRVSPIAQLTFLVSWGCDAENVNAFFKGLKVSPKEHGGEKVVGVAGAKDGPAFQI